MKTIALVLSCEHAVNAVPNAYKRLFAPHQALLQTHRGIDFGSLAITNYLSQRFACDFAQAQTTRLLIDCNRSLTHPHCFSEISSLLSQEEKTQLIQQYYLPFRQEVERCIKKHIAQGQQVLHLSIHSFTPVLNNIPRNADIGLLYDPRRNSEKILARRWQKCLKQESNLRIRMNYPYSGTSNGFTVALRKQFADHDYAGIEVETNQALVANAKSLSSLSNVLASTLKSLITRPND